MINQLLSFLVSGLLLIVGLPFGIFLLDEATGIPSQIASRVPFFQPAIAFLDDTGQRLVGWGQEMVTAQAVSAASQSIQSALPAIVDNGSNWAAQGRDALSDTTGYLFPNAQQKAQRLAAQEKLNQVQQSISQKQQQVALLQEQIETLNADKLLLEKTVNPLSRLKPDGFNFMAVKLPQLTTNQNHQVTQPEKTQEKSCP